MPRITNHLLLIILLQVLFINVAESNPHFLTLRRNQGQTISTKRSYSTIGSTSFFGTNPDKHVFTDIRLHSLDNMKDHAVNFGGGIRFGEAKAKRIYGLNAFFDFRRQHHCSFNQLGLGFELIGRRWCFRINGYIPLNHRGCLSSSCLCNNYIGDYFVLKEGFQESLGGIDFDIETILKKFDKGDIRLAITPYYFNRKRGCQQNVYGSQFRFSANYSYLTFTILASHDSFFKGRCQAQLGLTIPFDFISNARVHYDGSYLRDKLYRPVQRQELIILSKRQRWTWNF